jgi:heme-degrading monooxygenase HmoA
MPDAVATVIARLQVADFDEWHAEYTRMHPHRQRCGERGRQLFRDVDDPRSVVVIFTWDSLQRAKAYFTSPELAASVGRAGGRGAPHITYLEAVQPRMRAAP